MTADRLTEPQGNFAMSRCVADVPTNPHRAAAS